MRWLGMVEERLAIKLTHGFEEPGLDRSLGPG
jgi:hypothetical protein